MSRIGQQPITIPEEVSVSNEGGKILVKGPKGQLEHELFPQLDIEIKKEEVVIKRKNDNARALHGLLRSIIANAVEGVSKGFEKQLELVGTGYRVKKEGSKIIMNLGFSHPVIVESSEGIDLQVEGNKEIIIRGIDKQKVGQVAADIRSKRKPEVYKGKGIRYKGEVIKLKPGKAAKIGASEGGA